VRGDPHSRGRNARQVRAPLSLSHTPSLFLALTLTLSRSLTLTLYTHTHTHSLSLSHTHTHTRSLAPTLSATASSLRLPVGRNARQVRHSQFSHTSIFGDTPYVPSGHLWGHPVCTFRASLGTPRMYLQGIFGDTPYVPSGLPRP